MVLAQGPVHRSLFVSIPITENCSISPFNPYPLDYLPFNANQSFIHIFESEEVQLALGLDLMERVYCTRE